MGQRLTAKSTFDIQTNLNNESQANGAAPAVTMSTPTVRRNSGIPTPRSLKKGNSTSSTATTMSSPDRSLTASPAKSRSTVSMNNNSSRASDDLNGNNSPSKSRIPVRSPSYKFPKNVCFGKSSQKAFIKPWYNTIAKSSSENNSLNDAFAVEDMKMALE